MRDSGNCLARPGPVRSGSVRFGPVLSGPASPQRPAMALLRAAALPAEGSPAWLPTHVQVTVVRARGLRCKGGGKPGTSDAYTIIQLGREKYSTSVAEKSTGNPEWREECAFELPPELGAPAGPARGSLVLTVMHRALVGMDRFLGQALVPLEPALQQGRAPDER